MSENMPKRNDFVVCTVDKIFNYGVEVKLEEYPGKKGFVPLSQIASRWVKNIRNFVKMGQVRVAKVIYINREKNQINLSFAMVQKQKEEQTLSEWRQTKRVQQLLSIVAQKMKQDINKIWDEITDPILDKYNSVYEAFQDIKRYGKNHILEIPERYRAILYEVINKNITINNKIISENIEVETTNPNGLDIIKKGFAKIPEEKDIETHLSYGGNGKYIFKAEAKDYKTIERYLSKVNKILEKHFSTVGTISIKRIDK